MSDIESLLRMSPTTKAQKADAWDAYNSATSADDLAQKLNAMNLPKSVKADLWDMKSSESPQKTAQDVPPPPIQKPSPQAVDHFGLSNSGMAGRSGDQILAPINAKAALSSMAGAGDLMNRAVREAPGVMADYAVGGLKGLGGMADSAIKAIGLPRSEYADAALTPANTVQSVGSGVAQTGAVVGASEAALAAMGLSPIGAFIAKVATSPAGFGAGTAAYDLASGQDLKTAATHGAGASASVLAAKYLPAGISKLVSKMFPKASSAEIAAGVMEAQQALKNPEVQQALKAPEAAVASVAPDAKAAITKAQWDFKRQKLLQNGQDIGSWPGFSEPTARPIAPIPLNKLPTVLPDPVAPEVAPAPVSVPNVKPIPKVKAEPPKAPEPVPVAPEPAAAQDVSASTLSRMKHVIKRSSPAEDVPPSPVSSDVVTAPPAFPGQRSGATKARYEFQAQRQAKLRTEATAAKANDIADQIRKAFGVGGKPSEIKAQIAKDWNLSNDDASQLVNMIRGEIQ